MVVTCKRSHSFAFWPLLKNESNLQAIARSLGMLGDPGGLLGLEGFLFFPLSKAVCCTVIVCLKSETREAYVVT